MTDAEAQALRRENDYLKGRNAQLQADLTDVSAETERLRQALERTAARPSHAAPNPLGGGQ
jgi:prefoldin subunit 5